MVLLRRKNINTIRINTRLQKSLGFALGIHLLTMFFAIKNCQPIVNLKFPFPESADTNFHLQTVESLRPIGNIFFSSQKNKKVVHSRSVWILDRSIDKMNVSHQTFGVTSKNMFFVSYFTSSISSICFLNIHWQKNVRFLYQSWSGIEGTIT